MALLLSILPEADAEQLMDAVALDDDLRSHTTLLLLAADPSALSATLAHRCDELGVQVVAQPLDAHDQDDWDDVLDAVALAMRHFPDDPAVMARDDRAPDSIPSGTMPMTPHVADPDDLARELAVGMIVVDDAGVHVGQVTACDRVRQVLVVAPHLFAEHTLYIPFAAVATVDPESMTVRLTSDTGTLQTRFASLPTDA